MSDCYWKQKGTERLVTASQGTVQQTEADSSAAYPQGTKRRVKHVSNIQAFKGAALGADFCLILLGALMGQSIFYKSGGH